MKTQLLKIWAWIQSWFAKAAPVDGPASNDNAAPAAPWYLTAWSNVLWGMVKVRDGVVYVARAPATIRTVVCLVIAGAGIGGFVGGYATAVDKWRPKFEIAERAKIAAERQVDGLRDEWSAAAERAAIAEEKLAKLENQPAMPAPAAPKTIVRRKPQTAPTPAKLWGVF